MSSSSSESSETSSCQETDSDEMQLCTHVQSLWDVVPDKPQQPSHVTYVNNCSDVHVGDLVIVSAPIQINTVVQLVQRDVEPAANTHSTPPEPEQLTQKQQGRLCIIERRAWGAVPPSNANLLPNQLGWVVIVDTSTEWCSSLAENVLQVQRIQNIHMQTRGWWDIAYNFLIGGDGSVYEGRGWNVRGSTTLGFNMKSFSVAFIGSFDFKEPPKEQLTAALGLLEMAMARGQVAKDYKILAHCQLRPSGSPRKALLNIIKSWPRWTSDVPQITCDVELNK